jgi:UDP-glucuronate 4-epimerase
MKILVTGSAGFIGFHVAKALLERGDEVVGLDNFNAYYDPKLKESRSKELTAEKKFSLLTGDICDSATVAKAMKGVDRVCHLAAMAGVRYSFEHPEEYVQANQLGFFNVIDEAKKQKIDGLVYASTSSVYGRNEKMPFSEEDRTDDPVSLYAMTKRSDELMAHTYHHLFGLPVTGLRFFTVYGPWGRPDMALFLFTDAILNGKPIKIFGEGKMRRDFTYIDDIAAGVVAAIDKNHKEEIFNLGRGKQEGLMNFVGAIEKACGTEAKKEFHPMQPGDVRETFADIAKAKKMLGYDPKTSISEGVPKFVEWYKKYYKI